MISFSVVIIMLAGLGRASRFAKFTVRIAKRRRLYYPGHVVEAVVAAQKAVAC